MDLPISSQPQMQHSRRVVTSTFWIGSLIGFLLFSWTLFAACEPFPMCTSDKDCSKPLLCDVKKGTCEAECSSDKECVGHAKGPICVNLRCSQQASQPGGGTQKQALFLTQLQKHVRFRTVEGRTVLVVGQGSVEMQIDSTQRKITIKGANLQIVNGSGKTDIPSQGVGGLGNIIIGYNETNNQKVIRSGSHNLVVGMGHSYQSFGGVVAGQNNRILGAFSTVTGGLNNTARERGTSVSGGSGNEALNPFSSVSGGENNKAEANHAHISGGTDNKVNGQWGSILGGRSNYVQGAYSSVSGGENNISKGNFSSVLGGGGNSRQVGNVANGNYTSIVGGTANHSQGNAASILGGHKTTTSGANQTVLGNVSSGGSCEGKKVCQ